MKPRTARPSLGDLGTQERVPATTGVEGAL